MDKTSCHLLILKLLAYQILTHICKLVKLHQHGDRKFYKNLFHSKISLKRTTYLLLEAKKILFHCVRANKQHSLCQKPYATKSCKFLTGVQDKTIFWIPTNLVRESRVRFPSFLWNNSWLWITDISYYFCTWRLCTVEYKWIKNSPKICSHIKFQHTYAN